MNPRTGLIEVLGKCHSLEPEITRTGDVLRTWLGRIDAEFANTDSP